MGEQYYTLRVNGREHRVVADPADPLIDILRELGLSSVRQGCGKEQCGCCRVRLDQDLAYACTLPIADVGDRDLRTLEGMADGDQLHPLQAAFVDENAAQCGYCSSGILIAAWHLLETNPSPSRVDIQQALAGHLCRCGAHNRVIRAIQRAAR